MLFLQYALLFASDAMHLKNLTNKKMKLYYHKTDGGAEYLTNTYILNDYCSKCDEETLNDGNKNCNVCKTPKYKEGIIKGAKYVVRIDGDITKDAELLTDDIENVSQIIHTFRDLQKIAKTLHRLDENSCNYELSKAQKTRSDNLEKKAEKLANTLGLASYHQRDPRGCSLYLIDETMNNINYHDGIAIY